MRNTPLILGSSILIPPNSSNHFSTTPKSVPKLPSPPPNLSHSKTSSSPSARPLLSTVRWDLAFHRHQNSLNRYADLASKAAEVGNFDEFLVIAESVLVSGVKPFEFANLLDVQLVSAGIAGMIEEGEIGRVVKVLSGAQKLGIGPCELFDGAAKETLQRECSRIAKCGKVEKLVDLIEILNGFHFSTKELLEPAEVIRICVAKRKPNVAIRYARSFPNAHILFCNMILEFGKKGDFVSALCTFEASKQYMDCPNMYIYRTIIDVCGLCGDYLRSRSIYEDLLTQKVTPNIYVFNSLMNVNARDLSYTLHIYKHMQNLGIAADMTSYNILLKSCCRASRVDLAQDIYREVRHLESTGALKLDFYTYSTIIKAFADAKMWQMGLEIKDDMLAAGVAPNTITWSSLINACASAGLVEKAILLFEEMLLADCKPNSQCFNIVLHACVEACQYDRAFRLFHLWKGQASKKFSGKDCLGKIDIGGDYSHKSCTTVVPDCGSNSDRVNFTTRVPFSPTTVTYNIMMKACGTDYRRAKALMNEMKTLGLSPNQRSWSILIDVVGRSRNVEGAVQILTSMREAGLQPDVIAYTATIKVCVQNKHLKFAFSLFEEMKRYQLQPNLVTYNTLLRARSRYGSLQEVQQCLAIYQDMRKAGYSANDYYLKQLIEEWCEGILQGNNQNQGQHSSRSRTDLGGPQSLLLEKVAANLQKTDAESFAVDLQGLTKVEARIVVLAVLRMIKENYTPGKSVKDDMLIILGVQEVGSVAGKCNFNVKDAIIKLLRDDLGLEVLSAEHKSATKRKIGLDNPSRSHPNFETGTSGLPTRLESPTRRPADLQRLEVTRKSLYNWLQKRFGYSKS